MLNQVMAEIGARAARGEELRPALLARVDEIARKMPLAPEPFLIKGAVAQLAGRDEFAERLYLEARSRDPRSRAARYFLAEQYLRTQRLAPALMEMAVLARLTGASHAFAPGLAASARMPGAVAQLRRFFQKEPEFEPAVLSNLAADPGNLDLIFALWSGKGAGGDEGYPAWQAQIINALIDRGDFATAYSTWRRVAGIERNGSGLFNAQFENLAAPPPFNWTFGTSGGVAEPTGDGRLQVIYYGREDAVFADQMLILVPGSYRLAMNVSGELKQATGIGWTLQCLPQNRSILELPVRSGRSRARLQASFTVPSDCLTQRLRLTGFAGEFPKPAEFAISDLQLKKAPG